MILEIKKLFKYSDFQKTNEHVDENFSLIVVNHNCRLVDQLKKLYRVSTIFSSIFFDKNMALLTPGTIFHETSL